MDESCDDPYRDTSLTSSEGMTDLFVSNEGWECVGELLEDQKGVEADAICAVTCNISYKDDERGMFDVPINEGVTGVPLLRVVA